MVDAKNVSNSIFRLFVTDENIGWLGIVVCFACHCRSFLVKNAATVCYTGARLGDIVDILSPLHYIFCPPLLSVESNSEWYTGHVGKDTVLLHAQTCMYVRVP
jgi:hypothetical protein